MPAETSGPQRTCIGCRRTRPQSELVRLYLDGRGRLLVGRAGPGRGAWVCCDQAKHCLTVAVERKALGRAFRRSPDGESVAAVLDAWPHVDLE